MLIQSSFLVFSQTHIFSFQNTIPVAVNGIQLKNPWAGGFNSAQIGKMNLDDDGIEDLVIFDKTALKISTFLFKSGSFTYEPRYELGFPPMQSWMQLVDYDGDGKKDIFTTGDYANDIAVYKNTSNSNAKSWVRVNSALAATFVGGNVVSIYSSSSDHPSIADIDDDGDIDIVTYSGFGTNTLEFFINRSMEIYGDLSHLSYEKYTACYGKFSTSHECNMPANLSVTCPAFLGGLQENSREMHAGASISIFDLNGDGKKDIVLGDVNCNTFRALFNAGTNTNAMINSSNNSFPLERPVNIQSFPACFFEDVDGDSIKDFLATPYITSNDDYMVDFENSLWVYKNIGTKTTPNFSFTGKNFLQNEMIDFGETASPAFFDYDFDGDIDLFVANRGNYRDGSVGKIALLKNIGTKDSAQFLLIERDYLTLSGLNFSDFRIGFAPIDDNKSIDLYFLATNALGEGALYFIPNERDSTELAGFNSKKLKPLTFEAYYSYPDNPVEMSFGKFSKSDYVHIFKYKNELKLLFGTYDGQLQLYSNTFTGGLPNFILSKANFLGIENIEYSKNAVKAITKLGSNDSLYLYITDYSGQITIYKLSSLADNNFTLTKTILLDSIPNTLRPTNLGNSSMLAIANLRNNDTIPDLIIGTKGGGILHLSNVFDKTKLPPTSTSNLALGTNNLKLFKIYPNPVETFLHIETKKKCQIKISDFVGKIVVDNIALEANSLHNEDLSKFTPGMYFVEITNEQGVFYEKIIVKMAY